MQIHEQLLLHNHNRVMRYTTCRGKFFDELVKGEDTAIHLLPVFDNGTLHEKTLHQKKLEATCWAHISTFSYQKEIPLQLSHELHNISSTFFLCSHPNQLVQLYELVRLSPPQNISGATKVFSSSSRKKEQYFRVLGELLTNHVDFNLEFFWIAFLFFWYAACLKWMNFYRLSMLVMTCWYFALFWTWKYHSTTGEGSSGGLLWRSS